MLVFYKLDIEYTLPNSTDNTKFRPDQKQVLASVVDRLYKRDRRSSESGAQPQKQTTSASMKEIQNYHTRQKQSEKLTQCFCSSYSICIH